MGLLAKLLSELLEVAKLLPLSVGKPGSESVVLVSSSGALEELTDDSLIELSVGVAPNPSTEVLSDGVLETLSVGILDEEGVDSLVELLRRITSQPEVLRNTLLRLTYH